VKVLVTGAGGFLGEHVVSALVAAGHEVRALARSRPAAAGTKRWGSVELVQADLLTSTDLRPLCRGVDVIVHLAAAMSGSRQLMVETAVRGTLRLIDALDGPQARLVLASSFSVYDWDRVGSALDENSPLLTASKASLLGDYALAKLMQESAAREACAQQAKALTVLRPAMVWDAHHQGLDCAGPRAGHRRCIVAPGRRLHLTYVENCASAFVAALDERARGATYNVEDGMDLEANHFVSRVAPDEVRFAIPRWALAAVQLAGAPFTLAARMGLRVPGLLIPARSRARFSGARIKPSRLQTDLGWQPPFTFDQALTGAATHSA
jgi:2-alkyl-3-oxoalkanoate reductase